MSTCTVRTTARYIKGEPICDREIPCRLTPKRVYARGRVYNRATGFEIIRRDLIILSPYKRKVIAINGEPIHLTP